MFEKYTDSYQPIVKDVPISDPIVVSIQDDVTVARVEFAIIFFLIIK